jgi:nitrate/TMAO reductase-like tetraheme cytochrome c subunit
MSHYYQQDREQEHFEAWLDENSWTKLAGDFYECAGCHVWHEDDVMKEYQEAVKGGWEIDD